MNRVRGDFLLSPIFLCALAALLINDFYLKIYHPSAVSGILSDLAGMVFFPIFIVGIAEIACVALPAKPFAKPSWFVSSTCGVVVMFVLMKYTPVGEELFIASTDWLRGSFGEALGYGQRGLVSDPVDLLAILMIPIPIYFGRRVRGSGN